jgi:PhzF family phenazine biosynthesis protein
MASTEWMTVFADGTGGGNPCPVVFDFDGSTDQMQARAAKFGVETVFVLPTAHDGDVELRYFVPRHEMEMCVHATIAATTLLVEDRHLTSNPARVRTVLGTLEVAWDATHVLVTQFPAAFGQAVHGDARERVLRALNIDERALGAGEIMSVSTARAKLIVPLADEATLDGLEPDFALLWSVCDKLEVTGFYPFARLPDPGSSVHAAARQFPRRTGYDEDPATGVAACALGAYLSVQSGSTHTWQTWTIAQGRAMGRPSLITAEARTDEHGAVVATRVGGAARRLGIDESRSL